MEGSSREQEARILEIPPQQPDRLIAAVGREIGAQVASKLVIIEDGARIGLFVAMRHLAPGQGVTKENRVDGLEKEFRRQIHDGEIFVIEPAMFFRRIAIAVDKVIEHVQMGGDVAVEIHRARGPG